MGIRPTDAGARHATRRRRNSCPRCRHRAGVVLLGDRAGSGAHGHGLRSRSVAQHGAQGQAPTWIGPSRPGARHRRRRAGAPVCRRELRRRGQQLPAGSHAVRRLLPKRTSSAAAGRCGWRTWSVPRDSSTFGAPLWRRPCRPRSSSPGIRWDTAPAIERRSRRRWGRREGTAFNGDCKAQGLSKDDYRSAFAAADEKYAHALDALLRSLAEADTGSATGAKP